MKFDIQQILGDYLSSLSVTDLYIMKLLASLPPENQSTRVFHLPFMEVPILSNQLAHLPPVLSERFLTVVHRPSWHAG